MSGEFFLNNDLKKVAPGDLFYDVVPDDSNDLPRTAKAIYVGGDGDIRAESSTGSPVTFVGVPAGTTLIGLFKRIYATGTTATSIVAYSEHYIDH